MRSILLHAILSPFPTRKLTAEDVLKAPRWPEKYPFSPSDFKRMDESTDTDFYSQPRLVLHIGKLERTAKVCSEVYLDLPLASHCTS